MIKEEKNSIRFLDWESYGVEVVYTQKSYGNVMEKSREELKKDFGFEEKTMIAGKQTHSSHVVCVDSSEKLYFEDTDGFFTQQKDFVLFTKYADCMPVFFLDPVQEVIGVVHSGWKGSFQEIAAEAIELACQHYGSKKTDIRAMFGVGISKNNYEVGKEFRDQFSTKFSLERVSKVFEEKDGKLFFDNQEFIRQTLLEKGLLPEHIVGNALCSFQGNFHSYRRDKENSGRNGAFIYFSSKDFHNK